MTRWAPMAAEAFAKTGVAYLAAKVKWRNEDNSKNKRAVNNMIVQLHVEQEDVQAILDDADANKDGLIERSELLPALAAWSMLAEMKVDAMQKSTMCSLL